MLLRIQLLRVFCVGRGVIVLLMVLLMHRISSVSLVFIPSVVCVPSAGTGAGVGDCSVRVTCWYRCRCG